MVLRQPFLGWKTATMTAVLIVLAGCRMDAGGTTPPPSSFSPDPSPLPTGIDLSEEERAELLHLARDTIRSYLEERQIPAYQPIHEVFLRPGGAFVTLEEQGKLRGCIGYTWAEDPIYETIQRAAVAAATRDPRFPPVQVGELDQITIEISLLSPMERVVDVDDIVVGVHGLMIRQGYYQGLLLPQVAPDQGWNREEFLQGVCRKAGLPLDAWRDPATELYAFSAEVFGEEE